MKQSPSVRHRIVGYGPGSDYATFQKEVAYPELLSKYVHFDEEDPNGFDSYEIDYDHASKLVSLPKGDTLPSGLDYFVEAFAAERQPRIAELRDAAWTVKVPPVLAPMLRRRFLNAKIENLRETYGPNFAEGFPGDETLGKILPKLDQMLFGRHLEGSSIEGNTVGIPSGRTGAKRKRRSR